MAALGALRVAQMDKGVRPIPGIVSSDGMATTRLKCTQLVARTHRIIVLLQMTLLPIMR
jgi:hypothetical protein